MNTNEAKRERRMAGDRKAQDDLETYKKRLKMAIDATSQNRAYQVDDVRFAAGSPDNKFQWPEQVVRSREGDPNGPRPVLTINKLPQHIFQITNEQRHNRPSIKVLPVDDKADKELAEVLTGIVRHIEYNSDADIAYSTAGECQVTSGEGYIRVLTDYTDEQSFEQDILIEQVKNSFSIYFEPVNLLRDASGRYCEWAFVVVDMLEEDFKAQYPEADPIDWDETGIGDNEKWFPEKGVVRVAEHFYTVHEEKTICLWPDGSVSVKDDPEVAARYIGQVPVKERVTDAKRIKWCKMNGKQVIEERDWPGKYIPIVRMVGNEWYIEGKFVTCGIVRNAKDAQRMFNYWKSTEAETLALAPKAPYVGSAEAFRGFEDDWQEANTKNLAYLKFNQFAENGERNDKPERQIPPMPPVGIVNAGLGAADDIKSATGQYDPSLGNSPQAKSGVALQREQRKTDMGTFHYIDNQARGIRQLGRIIVDLVPPIFDTARIARIIGEDGEPDSARLDPKQQTAVAEVADENGVMQKIYNPSIGKFDVTVSVGPGYTSKRQEAAEFMAQVLQGNKELMAVMGDLYFEMLDVPGAEKIAERLKKTLPPGLAEKEEGEEEEPMVQTPEGPVPIEQAGQMMMQMMQQIQELSDVAEKAKLLDKEVKQASAQTAQYQAETERLAAISKADLNEATIKQMIFEAVRDYVDRTPAEDSQLLSPLHEPEIPAGDGQQGATGGTGGGQAQGVPSQAQGSSGQAINIIDSSVAAPLSEVAQSTKAVADAVAQQSAAIAELAAATRAPRRNRMMIDGETYESTSETMEGA